MELEEGILTRRSIRKYIKGKEIAPDIIQKLLRAAMYAPSAMNRQPWEFIVVDDKDKFTQIMQVHPYSAFLGDASLAVIVCGDLQKQLADNYWMVDCAAATQNLLLAAHGNGLGACWCGIYPTRERMEDFHRILNLPPQIQPLSMVVLGYPEKIPSPSAERYDPAKVHSNQW